MVSELGLSFVVFTDPRGWQTLLEVVCDSHIFDGTHYARWKRHMLHHFRELGPKAWWIIVVGFSHDALDKDNLTQAQEDCLQLDLVLFII